MSGQDSVSDPSHRPARRPAEIAVAVVERDNQFLVRQRPSGAPMAGLWEFPGGKIQPGETPQAAARRECLEETCLAVEIVGAYPSQSERYSHGAVALRFFAARVVSPQPRPEETWGWVPRRELAQLEFPSGNRRLIEMLLAEAPAEDV